MLRDGDDCSFGRFVHHNRDHRCWREGAADHLGGIICEGDDVYLFAAKLLNHRLDARAALPNNGANGIEPNLMRSDDHLAAVPWLTCNRADLNETCADLWHLKLKELLDEVLMRARQENLWATHGGAHLKEERLDVLADAEGVEW